MREGIRSGFGAASCARLSLLRRGCSGAGLEAPGVVAGLHDVAMMGQSIEQGGSHLGVAEDIGPFCEAQVGGDHHAGAFVEFGQQMEQQCAARGREGQIALFVEDHQIGAGQDL